MFKVAAELTVPGGDSEVARCFAIDPDDQAAYQAVADRTPGVIAGPFEPEGDVPYTYDGRRFGGTRLEDFFEAASRQGLVVMSVNARASMAADDTFRGAPKVLEMYRGAVRAERMKRGNALKKFMIWAALA